MPSDLNLLPPLAAIVLLACVARIAGRSWLAPAAFLPLCWTAYLGSAILLAEILPLRAAGLWLIVSMVFAFVVGALFATNPLAGELASASLPPERATFSQRVSTRLSLTTAAFSVFALLGVVGIFQSGLASFGLALVPQTLLRLGREFSVARYGVGVDVPLVVNLLLYWTYPASVLGGMVFALARSRGARLLGLVPLVLAFASGLLTATRSGILLSGVMWASAVLAVTVCCERGTGHLFRARWVATGGGAALFLVAIAAFLIWVRRGAGGSFNVLALVLTVIEAFFGAISVFTTWFAVAEPGHPTWGAFTFAGPFDLFQWAERRQGLYDTTIYFASAGSGSNIYTVFRGMIEDFGYTGIWLMCFALGAGSAIAYRRCGEGLVTWVVPLSVFYSQSLFSHLYSMFIFNSVIVGWSIALLVLLWPISREGQAGHAVARSS